MVIGNASFFEEIEAVIRSFLLSDSCFASDEALFALARGIPRKRRDDLEQLRKRPAAGCTPESMDAQIIQQLRLLMILFFGHELGHIKDEVSDRSFMNMLGPAASLEDRVEEAVLRLCRHAEEFDRLGFNLPGFEAVIDVNSEIRASERRFREDPNLATSYENCKQWYKAEISADEFAYGLLVDYLTSLEAKSKMQALEAQHLFIGAIFFTSIYYWYKDLDQFAMKACGRPIHNSQQLMVCVMQEREQYVKVASLFGRSHRFLLLRGHLAIEHVLEKRTNYFKLDPSQRTIWVSEKELDALEGEEKARRFWYSSDLQKYCLLAILMDTPVKFAHVGAAMGWINEIDKKRGTPQLLMMNFEPINVAMRRLLRIP